MRSATCQKVQHRAVKAYISRAPWSKQDLNNMTKIKEYKFVNFVFI